MLYEVITGKWPDLQGIEALVDLENGFGRIELKADRLQVQWPRMFRQPVEFIAPTCHLDMDWRNNFV